jgi:hypothetical protein
MQDPRAVAEAEALRAAGHIVLGTSSGDGSSDWITTPGDPTVADQLRRRSPRDRAVKTSAGLGADLYIPTHPRAVAIATLAAAGAGDASVLVKPGWPRPDTGDLIELSPTEPWRSLPGSGVEPGLHVPGARPVSPVHRPGTVIIAYRNTGRNPGRYLESALRRAGLDVIQTETIDWQTIDRSALAVVVVESPLPGLRVIGSNPGIPVVFWAHHGEHHIDQNARLQRRYGAHAVLLAHSWHLAHRFWGHVDRLPFAVAPELFTHEFRSHASRRWDVGFVGAPAGSGDRYAFRDQVLTAFTERLGEDRVMRRSNVTPEEMAAIYRDSRIVVDDGAGRHLPITMRTFEATGAGALLVTNPGPGTSLLFTPGRDYLTLGEDAADSIDGLGGDTEPVARSGYRAAWDRHTYDHRVAELLSTVDRLRDHGLDTPPADRPTGLAAVVDRFPDAQRILDLGGSTHSRLPGREVWTYEQAEDRAEPGTFHLSVITTGSRKQQTRAVRASRLGVVAPVSSADSIADLVRQVHGTASRHDYPSGVVFTFGSTGYRHSPDPDPE